VRFPLSSSVLVIAGALVLAFGQRADPGINRNIDDRSQATKAKLFGPTGLAISGSKLYIVESVGKRLRQVNLETGTISTLAGGGGLCSHGKEWTEPNTGCFGWPQRVAVDSADNAYVTNEGIGGIVKIDARTHSFSIIAAKLEWPAGVAVGPSSTVFFDEHTAHTVYRMALSELKFYAISGTGHEGHAGTGGPASDAELRYPDGLALDTNGNLLIADYGNCRIQRVDAATGLIATVTGTEERGITCESLPDYGATLNQPTDVAVGPNGDVFFVQPYRHRVQRFNVKTNSVTTVAGSGQEGFAGDGGLAVRARLHFPNGITFDKFGNLFIADTDNGRVRRVDAKSGIISTIAGNGPVMRDILL
jgi:trimeric autotransporter adhesin